MTRPKRKPRKPTQSKMLELYAEQYDWGEGPVGVQLTTPLRVVSEANKRGHWSKRYKRKSEQAELLCLALPLAKRLMRGLPVTVITLIRVGRRMDDDNLRGAFKAVRDAIADWLHPGLLPGRADEHFKWEYDQAPAKGGQGTIIRFRMGAGT